MMRKARIERATLETKIELELELDGSGKTELQTGIPFLEHMLTLWCRHGSFDLHIKAEGDLEVEPHHLVEDTGLCLGRALYEALGTKEGICRYGDCAVPMDDALVMAVVDFSGRPYLHYGLELPPGPVGSLDPELFGEFWQALVNEGRLNLHLRMFHGQNKHHIIEASFKAAARAMRKAVDYREGCSDILSTKGTLE